MQGIIKILPDFIANQIAAGEVVQRPESVVKELIENAMDAGATEIAVVVKNSGKHLIHILDNGDGMTKEDLQLSVKRHATSKVFTTQDLEEIRTYGFRGEALASIASVANLEIRSRTKDMEHGWKLTIEPMKSEIIEAVNMDFGTQIFVRNLFFNVPARRKFLKADITEFRYISDTMIRFALSKPHIRFTFYDNEVLVFDTKPCDIVQRIEDVLGRSTANSLIPVFLENEKLKIEGFIGEPLIAKQSKSGQFLYLNGRHIVNKSLSYAVYSAFEHLLEKRSQPIYILNIQIDPKEIDVNVHPQKHEVKFDDERYVYNLVNQAVTTALQSKNLIPESTLVGNIMQSPFDRVSQNDSDELMIVNRHTGEVLDMQQHHEERNPSFNFAKTEYENRSFSKPNQNFDLSAFDNLFGKKFGESSDIDSPAESIDNQKLEYRKPEKMYWQLHKKYIFSQTEKGVIVIDQHAAHERILFEKALKAMNKEFSNSQEILFPVRLQLNSSQKLLLSEIEAEIKLLGFNFSKIQDNEIEINSVPLDINSGSESQSFLGILEQYEEYERTRESNKRDNLAASFGCKSAIKAGHYLNQEEMSSLMNDLFSCSMPYVCPHGRPIMIEFTIPEFDRRFGRT